MFPNMVRYITDDTCLPSAMARYLNRREWLMRQCTGPIVLSSPAMGPNQQYAWAQCDAPMYQDSYLLFLTGINQYPMHMILEPSTGHHHLFLPQYTARHAFWDGQRFCANHSDSIDFLTAAGFTHIHPLNRFHPWLTAHGQSRPTWHVLRHATRSGYRKDDTYRLIQSLKRHATQPVSIASIADISWHQRAQHCKTSIRAFKTGIEKTRMAYMATRDAMHTFTGETDCAGFLKGQLLQQTPHGLSFPPIVAKNDHAAILHYVDACASFSPKDLVLLDFGLRWQSMCTDISRTIHRSGNAAKRSPLQARLTDIVLETQQHTIDCVKPGVTFDELNDACWSFMEQQLAKKFIAIGGRMHRDYTVKPHNVGHLLGIQTHDGDALRNYASSPLLPGSILTIEPGLYGHFELNGDSLHCGIRIEDNIIVTTSGHENASKNIPK